MYHPIVVLVLLASPMQSHMNISVGPVIGFPTLKECMQYATDAAPRVLMQTAIRQRETKWAVHSVGCANNRVLES